MPCQPTAKLLGNGRDSHPLDDYSDFQKGFTFPSSRQARISRPLPGRFSSEDAPLL
jgi:hypothetical protein